MSVDEIQARLSVSVVVRDMDWNSSLLLAKSTSEPCILEITEAEDGFPSYWPMQDSSPQLQGTQADRLRE